MNLLIETLERPTTDSAAGLTLQSVLHHDVHLALHREVNLPTRLQELLDSPYAKDAFTMAMTDLGTRLYLRLLFGGLLRGQGETDLEQNYRDVHSAALLLGALACECANTPLLPRDTTELLSRIGNALSDVWKGAQPALFKDLALARWRPSDGRRETAGVKTEGSLAASLEIVIRGGMKLAAAKDWLDAGIKAAGLVDEAGNPIGADRVANWRHNFRQRMGGGAREARFIYNTQIDEAKPLLRGPPGEQKMAACKDFARGLLEELALFWNRTVSPPLVKN